MVYRLATLLAGVSLLLAAACGDDGNGNGNGSDSEAETENAPSPTIQQNILGTLSVETAEVAVGEMVRVTGQNWRSTDAIAFYIGTPDQAVEGARSVATGLMPQVGEASPAGDGTVTFEFTLEEGYDPKSGEPLAISSGETYAILGLQGSTGTQAGTFTVR
jgi:hypothetical protein